MKNKTATSDKLYYYCPKCGTPHHYRLHRNWLLKYVLFFVPVGKYFCAKCKKGFYAFRKENAMEY